MIKQSSLGLKKNKSEKMCGLDSWEYELWYDKCIVWYFLHLVLLAINNFSCINVL